MMPWALIIFFMIGYKGGATTVPMASENACVVAQANIDQAYAGITQGVFTLCISTQTGQILEAK